MSVYVRLVMLVVCTWEWALDGCLSWMMAVLWWKVGLNKTWSFVRPAN